MKKGILSACLGAIIWLAPAGFVPPHKRPAAIDCHASQCYISQQDSLLVKRPLNPAR